MKNIGVFTALYVASLWKRKMIISLYWFIPILFLVGMGIIGSQLFKNKGMVEPFQIAIINHDPTFETKLVVNQLTENDDFKKLMKPIQTNEKTAQNMMKKNEIASIIIIPKGFSRDVAQGINTPVKVVGNSQRPLQSQLVLHVMDSAAYLTSAAQSGINTIHDFMLDSTFSKQERKEELKKNIVTFSLHVLGRGNIYEEKVVDSLFQRNLVEYYSVSFYVFLLMIWSFTGLVLLDNYLSSSVEARLQSRGVSAVEMMLAKLTVLFLLVLMSSFIASLLLMWKWPIPLLKWTLGSVVMILACCTLFLFLEKLLFNVKVYQMVGGCLLIVGAISGGHMIPTVYFPHWLELLGKTTVNYWGLKFFLSGEIAWGSIINLSAVSVLCLVFTVLLTRYFQERGRLNEWGFFFKH